MTGGVRPDRFFRTPKQTWRYRRGVSIAGPEYGAEECEGENSGGTGTTFTTCGVHDDDFLYPQAADIAYLRSRLGAGAVLRLNHRLERLFTGPTSVTMQPAERDRITALLDAAAAHDLGVVIAPWNFGAVWTETGGVGVRRPIGSAHYPIEAFAAHWQAMAGDWDGHPGVAAFELMTEPVGLPPAEGSPARTWEYAAQAALDAVRRVTQDVWVWVPSYGWSIWSIDEHPGGPWIVDPTGRFGYAGHQYHYNCGGSETDYADAVASAAEQGYRRGAEADALHARELAGAEAFRRWAAGHPVIISEYGIPQAEGSQVTGGPQWRAYAERLLRQYDAYGWSAICCTAGQTSADILYAVYYPRRGWGEVVDSATSAAAVVEAHPSVSG